MPLKNKLNQYELDMALAVLRDKRLPLHELKQKTVAVSGGGDLHRAILYSLLYLNETKALDMSVISVGERFSTLYEDDGFCVKEPDELGAVDYYIEAGFLRYAGCDDAAFSSCIDRAMRVTAALSKAQVGRVLLLSSAAVYGTPDREMSLSENEYSDAGFALSNATAVMLQCVENIFAGAAHMHGFTVTTLRCAALTAPFAELEVSEKLLQPLSQNQPITFAPHGRKVTLVSINDLLTALYYGLLLCDAGEVYNVGGDDSALSPLMLAAVTEELFGAAVSIEDDGVRLHGCAVNCDKLKQLGWAPLVGAKDALLIAKNAYDGSDRVFMFSDSYDGKLSAVQQTLLGFLKEVDRICRKNDIQYFLGGGSLLGAVRHKGFIPWDDDADVMMLRDDYEKFRSVLKTDLPPYITDQNTEEANHFAFTKLRLNDTILSTEFSARFKGLHNGVFLDVLAQDKTAKKGFAQKLHMKMTAQLRWLVLNKWRGTPMNANNKLVSFIGDVIKAILPLSLLEKMQNGIMKRYHNKDTGMLYDSMGRNVERGAFPEEWLNEAVYVDFEDTKLPIPKEWDKYLTYLYGDYMDMIPVSERHVSHDIVRIDLGRFIDYGEKS
ncbi:LicD family protein [uncultured Ruminococcus sp.]|uniref:LicD family protein n=1 Tax=uncultured Ruminococcus sp. TaxID=165186 RepID=UPI0029312EFB|nr:LicD family protein [uncultured Ruminococcus sp.]